MDPYLGLRTTDINVAGGGYVDGYSSYAPEELVPGSEFDTLDFRVYNNYNNPLNQYNNTTQYVTGDRIGYLGLVYQASQNTIGNLPTNTTYWGQVIPLDSRIFQDMRGLQMTYTITDETTTELLEIDQTHDTIYVTDASKLSEPNFDINQWGVLTIGAERIMYRERDLGTNSVSGLIRGTAGTAVTTHLIGDPVYNLGRDNLYGQQYQNYIVQTTTLSDGSTTVFDAPNITLSTSTTTWAIGNTYSRGDIVVDSGSFYRAQTDVPANTALDDTQPPSEYQPTVGRPYWQPLDTTVEVYVGGLRLTSDLYTVTDQAPVSVTLDDVPVNGVNVTILVRRGTWIDY
jgi:hypothetical protein